MSSNFDKRGQARKNKSIKGPAKARRKSKERLCYLVLGMHRSGTSAVTRILNMMGAELPKNLLDANPTNVMGHWEPARLIALHDELLNEIGSKWDDFREIGIESIHARIINKYKKSIKKIIKEEYLVGNCIVLKDPRVCRFVPLYLSVLSSMGYKVCVVQVFRNPLEVAASLHKRDGLRERISLLLWLRHVLDAERSTREVERVTVSYEGLIENWRETLSGITKDFSLETPGGTEQLTKNVERFLSEKHRHHQANKDELEPNRDVPIWLTRTYEAMCAMEAGGDQSEIHRAFDDVRNELNQYERIYDANYREELDFLSERFEAKTNEDTSSQITMSSNDVVSSLDSVFEELNVSETIAIREMLSLQEDLLKVANLKEKLEGEIKFKENSFKEKENFYLSEIEFRDSEISKSRRGIIEKEDEYTEIVEKKDAELEKVQELRKVENSSYADRVVELESKLSDLTVNLNSAQHSVSYLEKHLSNIYLSRSWRITAPFRRTTTAFRGVLRWPEEIGRWMFGRALGVWRRLPVTTLQKNRIKTLMFRSAPFVFRNTVAFRSWKLQRAWSLGRADNQTVARASPGFGTQAPLSQLTLPKPEYVPIIEKPPMTDAAAKLIAFYLPQFHQIQENDEWWGEGFTEWTNVKPAEPLFAGHEQPRKPGELGYYDLSTPDVQKRQIELARLYGIHGFCFYFYWFGGKRLLEKPVENWLENPDLDLPFCLCWANENWSRRWDGLDQEVLIAQKHSESDDLAFIQEISRYLSDSRYIRVDGKPLLLVYRPSLLPSPRETVARWRKWCRENGVGEIFLAYTQSFENADPAEYGFDAAVEFPPNNAGPVDLTTSVQPFSQDFGATVYDWTSVARTADQYEQSEYLKFRTVCPGWDNTARRKKNATVFVNNTPDRYENWLVAAIDDTIESTSGTNDRLIFVNAWNEWAEAAYLEPDAVNGYAYLQATRNALERASGFGGNRIVIVSHDAHPHGAQYLALGMARTFREMGFGVDSILLDDGPLERRFEEVSTVHKINLLADDGNAVLAQLKKIRNQGAIVAIANTTVSGSIVPLLRTAGFRTIAAVHEMPTVLNAFMLHDQAKALADSADVVVFAADEVRQGFERFIGCEVSQALIRPQGLLRENPYKNRRAEARAEVISRLGLPKDCRIVLSVAFVDERKGPDRLIEAAQKVIAHDTTAYFVWIGHFDPDMKHKVDWMLKSADLEDRVRFLGYVESPMEFYAAASVYALPSREDPFPNVVLEAAAVGVPTVAFDGSTGAGKFILEHGGLLASPDNTDDFAKKTIQLLDAGSSLDGGRTISMRQYLLDLLNAVTGFVRVSVVVPNYNYEKHLMQRLQSIADQTYPIYEVIILDDASTDSSREVIDRWAEDTVNLDVQIECNERNSGSVFRQWQNGISRCFGDAVWIAEADDFAENTFLQQLAPGFVEDDLVISYSQSRQVDDDGIVLAEDYLDYTDDISGDWRADYHRDGLTEIANGMVVKNTIPNVSAALFRRSALLSAMAEVGQKLYHFKIAGDWLLYVTMLQKGKIRYRSRALNSHRRHRESVTISSARDQHIEEVADMQAHASSLVEVSAQIAAVRKDWLEHVKRYLNDQPSSAA